MISTITLSLAVFTRKTSFTESNAVGGAMANCVSCAPIMELIFPLSSGGKRGTIHGTYFTITESVAVQPPLGLVTVN